MVIFGSQKLDCFEPKLSMLQTLERLFSASMVMRTPLQQIHIIANIRAGPPVPPRYFGAPITKVAPLAGTASKLAIF
jgi:hypothetical protein